MNQSLIEKKRMTESVTTQFKNTREKNIIFTPRDGDEMRAATLHKVPIYTYSDLCQIAEKGGAARMLSHLFKRSNKNIILLQDPDNMNSGHWISVSRNPQKKEIYFFSTYGGKPDTEKIRWMTEDDLRESNQFLNIFNDGLRECQEHGWEIHYNDYPYQKEGDHTATCGIYTAAFLRSGEDPDKFKSETLQLIHNNINPAVYYYDKYFNT